jgi:hypothetical protein
MFGYLCSQGRNPNNTGCATNFTESQLTAQYLALQKAGVDHSKVIMYGDPKAGNALFAPYIYATSSLNVP